MTTLRAIGIDLGTTHTVVAESNAVGHTALLRTRDNETLVPSVVLFADERTVVGREAQLRGRAHPDRLAARAKQQLGQAFYDQRIGGELLPPEVIEACILRSVQSEWLLGTKGRCGVVIAVPAHFNESQRHAVATAAEMSGLPLLDLVNEPIAAALAFAEHTTDLVSGGPDKQPHHVLVYDLGGYTCEATVLRASPGQLQMLVSEHDSLLGGHDWDLRLADLLAEPFIRKLGTDPRTEPLVLEQLLQRAAQVKLALSVRSHTSLRLSFGGHSEKLVVTRPQFDGISADLLDRTGQICESALRQAKLQWSDLRSVLLVGGAARMPMVRRYLAQKTDRPLDDRVCPDEAVARGAAIYAARILQGQATPPTLRVTSLSTHSLGIEGSDQETGRRINKVLIPKGTPLPASVTREFVGTSNAARDMVFNVLEGEDCNPAKCITIGRVILHDLPPDVTGQWPVEVKLDYSQSGRLTVDAWVRYTDRHVHLETIRPGGVTRLHVARWQAVIAAQSGLAAYRQVRDWERAVDAPPPLVLAGINLPEQDLPETSGETGGAWSFLKRMMPFAFRRASPTAEQPAVALTKSEKAEKS